MAELKNPIPVPGHAVVTLLRQRGKLAGLAYAIVCDESDGAGPHLVAWDETHCGPLPTREELATAATLPNVPTEITRLQGKAVLLQAGYVPQIEQMMADPKTPALAKLAWSDAQVFRRDSPTLLAMAQALGISEAQLDQLFIQGAQIEA
jgi:hypothetical protein